MEWFVLLWNLTFCLGQGHSAGKTRIWLDKDDDEEPEEDEADEDNDEEMEEEEDEEEEVIVAEDEAEIIYPYDDADPNNRPPPDSDDESEFAPSVIPVFNAENRPVPPVDERIVKNIDRSDLHIRMVGRDAMSLDGAVRECQADVSKAGVREQYVPKFLLRGGFVETSTRSFLGPFPNNPYVQARNAAMADDDVEGDDVEDEDDMDDDAADPSDPQSSEPRGSPRDS
ncbi:hypothetical protein Tco_0226018 [Tanacetum coccineum]